MRKAVGRPSKKILGRPTLYTEDTPQKVLDYIEIAKSKGDLPTVSGVCLYLGICQDTYHEWKKHEDKQIFSDTAKILMAEQQECLIQGSLKGVYKERTSLMLLSSNHGLRDDYKREEIEPDVSLDQIKAVLSVFGKK